MSRGGAMAVMVQREVADRIASPPSHKAYGILTVKLAYWWRVVERFEVPARAFTRRQRGRGGARHGAFGAGQSPSPEIWPGLSKFVDAAFGQRRKMLFNSLAGRWPALANKEACRAALGRQA